MEVDEKKLIDKLLTGFGNDGIRQLYFLMKVGS